MKKQIRSSVFETNSSSTHSIVINSGEYQIPKDTNIDILTGEYGWEIDTYYGFYDKASYALTYAVNYGTINQFEMLNSVLEDKISGEITYNGKTFEEVVEIFDDLPYSSGFDWGYIDHQSVDEASIMFDSYEGLEMFIFSEHSYFETDNDNH